MRINAISSNNITDKGIRFRLPVKEYMTGIDPVKGEITHVSCNYMMVYKNPDARKIYKQALAAADIKEKARLFDEMGEYELVDMTQESRWSRMKHKIGEFFIRKFL